MILRFAKDLGSVDVLGHGNELAAYLGEDTDEKGRRKYTWPDDREKFVATLDNPVLITDLDKIAKLPAGQRDTVFMLWSQPVRVTEYGPVSMRFEQHKFPGVWGPSIDTLLFCRALDEVDFSSVRKMAEVGCGSSFIAKYASLQSPEGENGTVLEQVDLFDLNPRALDFASGQYKGVPFEVAYWLGDAKEHLPGGDYDLVMCNPPYVPRPNSHDDNPYEGLSLMNYLIAENARYLAPGGRLIINISSLARDIVDQTITKGGFTPRYLDSMEVPLKICNIYNNPGWLEYLRGRGMKEEMKDGYPYWQDITIYEFTNG